jgi:hypothetical protein
MPHSFQTEADQMKEWDIVNPGQGIQTFKGTHISMPSKEHPYVAIFGETNTIIAIVNLAPGGYVGQKQG